MAYFILIFIVFHTTVWKTQELLAVKVMCLHGYIVFSDFMPRFVVESDKRSSDTVSLLFQITNLMHNPLFYNNIYVTL